MVRGLYRLLTYLVEAMNRALLACLALALPLPSFADAAVPCDVPTYANQCQGSNLWPVPGGWTPDNDGDCQPEPAAFVAAELGYMVSGNSGLYRTAGELLASLPISAQQVLPWGLYQGPTTIVTSPTSQWAGACESQTRAVGAEELLAYSTREVRHDDTCGLLVREQVATIVRWPWCQNPYGLQSYSVPPATEALYWVSPYGGPYYRCIVDPAALKPSNGRCSARWVSAAKTDVQKDWLDPDCSASSCVIDKTCKLR